MSLVLGYGYVCLARIFAKQFIWITGILNIVFAFGNAIYMLSRKYYSGGIVFLIFGAFMILCFISWIPRIPFSALMLRTSVDVAKRVGHVYLVSFVGGLVAVALAAWFAVTLVAITVTYTPDQNNPSCRTNGCSQGKVIGLTVFVTFAMYWISEWLKNTIHTTISGVYGSWYFSSHNIPRDATRAALKRSLTYSFGSISLGSLVVAIINFLRQICSVAQQNEAADGNIVGVILFCILGCLISILQWAAEFLNRYAFSYIALYGDPYIKAAKATWKMIKDRGIDALINVSVLCGNWKDVETDVRRNASLALSSRSVPCLSATPAPCWRISTSSSRTRPITATVATRRSSWLLPSSSVSRLPMSLRRRCRAASTPSLWPRPGTRKFSCATTRRCTMRWSGCTRMCRLRFMRKASRDSDKVGLLVLDGLMRMIDTEGGVTR